MAEFLRNSDAFMWSIESDPRLRSTIVTLILLEGTPDPDDVVERFELLTRVVPRFRQRVAQSPYPLPPRWEDDPDFDLSFHLRRVSAPKPGALDSVVEMARVAAMAEFDRARPLWEATLVDGMSGGGSAMLFKLHHALTDGMGAVEMAASLFDRSPQRSAPIPAPALPRPAVPSPLEVIRDLALDGGKAAVTMVSRSLNAMPKLLVDGIRRPLGTATDVVSTVGSIYRTMRPIAHAESPIMAERSRIRRLAVAEVPKEKLRVAGAVVGGSLNEAFIAAISGGLSRYHEKHGITVDNLVVSMPISLRTPEDALGGNRATLMRFDAPSGDMDAAERIRLVHERTAKARNEKSLAYTQLIAGVLNAMPSAYVGSALRHVDFVASDVPGFSAPLYFAGVPVSMPFAFSPTIGAALNVTLLTYVDVCALGINVDTGAIPDLEDFYSCLAAGIDDVLALAH